MPRTAFGHWPARLAAVALLMFFVFTAATDEPRGEEPGPLRIGAVLDFTGALAEFGAECKNGALLAAAQINRAGGVLGRPLELIFADGATDPETTVAAARELVDDGVHAIVGAMGSEATLQLARRVTVPARVPTITPTATAPVLTRLEDDGYLFRTTASDAAQGMVLARLASDEGLRRVAVLYRDDAYGQGLFEVFSAHFEGEIEARAIGDERASYLDLLRELAGRDALVVLTFPAEAEVFVPEAVANGLFDRFLFSDATRSLALARLPGESLQGMKGTMPALRNPQEEKSTAAFVDAYRQEFGSVPRLGTAAGVYDAVVCLALAAERAGTRHGDAIRDALRPVCAGAGETYVASPASLAAAFEAVRAGRAIDFDGAGSSLDWDEAGDVTSGTMDIWQYRDGAIVSLERVPFDIGEKARSPG